MTSLQLPGRSSWPNCFQKPFPGFSPSHFSSCPTQVSQRKCLTSFVLSRCRPRFWWFADPLASFLTYSGLVPSKPICNLYVLLLSTPENSLPSAFLYNYGHLSSLLLQCMQNGCNLMHSYFLRSSYNHFCIQYCMHKHI